MNSLFASNQSILLPYDSPPQLIVVVDTEEEFDWSAKPSRAADAVTAMQDIYKAQSICEEYELSPCYVTDYPVASKNDGITPLIEFHKNNKCEIGVHLHPWVTPPYTEELTRSNMFPGNLSYDIEKEKISNTQNIISQLLDKKPTIYKAGRYGFGKNTAKILNELGFSIDLSACPPVDYSADGGPDYSDFDANPYFFGEQNNILGLPVTGAFVGCAGKLSKPLFNIAQRFKSLKAPAVLARTGIVDRLMLSPEGFTSDEHIKITKFLYAQGVRTFTWSFHSTSVVPGMAPYVKSSKDLQCFLDSFKKYFDFFFNELGGIATTPTKLKEQLEKLK